MAEQSSQNSSLVLRRELSAVSLDPWTLCETGRRLLPSGALIEAAACVLQFAQAMNLATVAIRVQVGDSLRVCVELVDVVELRQALGL